jgi:hypothetical protein
MSNTDQAPIKSTALLGFGRGPMMTVANSSTLVP